MLNHKVMSPPGTLLGCEKIAAPIGQFGFQHLCSLEMEVNYPCSNFEILLDFQDSAKRKKRSQEKLCGQLRGMPFNRNQWPSCLTQADLCLPQGCAYTAEFFQKINLPAQMSLFCKIAVRILFNKMQFALWTRGEICSKKNFLNKFILNYSKIYFTLPLTEVNLFWDEPKGLAVRTSF